MPMYEGAKFPRSLPSRGVHEVERSAQHERYDLIVRGWISIVVILLGGVAGAIGADMLWGAGAAWLFVGILLVIFGVLVGNT